MSEEKRKLFRKFQSHSLDEPVQDKNIGEYYRIRDRTTAAWLKKSTEKLTKFPEYIVRTGSLKSRKIFGESSRLSAFFSPASEENLTKFHSLKLEKTRKYEDDLTTVSEYVPCANTASHSRVSEPTPAHPDRDPPRNNTTDIKPSNLNNGVATGSPGFSKPVYVLQSGCYLWPGRAFHRESYIMQRRENAAQKKSQQEKLSEKKKQAIKHELDNKDIYGNSDGMSSSETSSANSNEMMYGKFTEEVYDSPRNKFEVNSDNYYEVPDNTVNRLPDLEELRNSEEYSEVIYNTQEKGERRKNSQSSRKPLNGEYDNIEFQEKYRSNIEQNNISEKPGYLKMRMREKIDQLEVKKKCTEARMKRNEQVCLQLSTQLSLYAAKKEMNQFSIHVQELGSVSCLLLGLAGRLAKVETSIEDTENRNLNKELFQLRQKREVLIQQIQEAKWIKSSIDKRSRRVEKCVERYLGADGLERYNKFIREKLDLITETRETEDKLHLCRTELRNIESVL